MGRPASPKRFPELLAQIAANFVNLPPQDVDQEIGHALRRSCESLGLQLATVLDWPDLENARVMVTHEWTANSHSQFQDDSVDEKFPWLAERLRRGEVVAIDRLDEFPAEAKAEQSRCAKIDIRSVVWVPFRRRDHVAGFVAFNSIGQEHPWTVAVCDQLRLLGQIFVNAIERRQADLLLRSAYEEVQTLKDRLAAENASLRDAHVNDDFVGRAPALLRVLELVEQVAATDSTILMLGETGSGKCQVARVLHRRSKRSDRPLIRVDCASLPEQLVESELFGHEKGAFTGAVNRTIGRFELADGGTLLLDEIGDLPAAAQVKLLRFLQDREFERVGSSRTITVDVRIIAATNRDLEKMVEQGTFRSDLYFRLSVFPILVPPLRERREDIPLLAWYFISKIQPRLGKTIDNVPDHVMRALVSHDWPGNVRELENVIERGMILSRNSSLQIGELSTRRRAMIMNVDSFNGPAYGRLEDVERDHIMRVLEECDWKIRGDGGAADRLGLKRTTLHSRMKKLGIQRPGSMTNRGPGSIT
jgi:transcriptional regulator with GAF, ATPase, and Fis domain